MDAGGVWAEVRCEIAGRGLVGEWESEVKEGILTEEVGQEQPEAGAEAG